MWRKVVPLLSVLTLSACATLPDISQSRSPCRDEPGGWCSFVREAAVEAYPFAIASLQAYVGDDDIYAYPLPMLERLERLPIAEEDERKGFGYEIFALYTEGTSEDPERQPFARILAFRGTDFDGLTDIFYGSLRDDQIEIALDTYEAEAARFPADLPWIVTGHSLGGALATEVSVAHPQVHAYMFNTSPFYRGEAMTNDMQRTVFNERGELLRRFARGKPAPAGDVFTINCRPAKGIITKHRIRLLADCITWIAAYSRQDAYDLVLAQEIPKPPVECGPKDKAHPGVGYRQLDPCIHQLRPQSSSEGN